MIIIFDLDGTVIDSSHRQLYDPITGLLDLANWMKNSTHEKIMADSLLPLAKFWRQRWKANEDHIVICTARVMGTSDFMFLANHGLHFDAIMSRPKNDRGTPDDLLKVSQLHRYLDSPELRDVPVIMFDDSLKVRHSIRRLRVPVLNPDSLPL